MITGYEPIALATWLQCSIPNGNRTHIYYLGGNCTIHYAMRTPTLVHPTGLEPAMCH